MAYGLFRIFFITEKKKPAEVWCFFFALLLVYISFILLESTAKHQQNICTTNIFQHFKIINVFFSLSEFAMGLTLYSVYLSNKQYILSHVHCEIKHKKHFFLIKIRKVFDRQAHSYKFSIKLFSKNDQNEKFKHQVFDGCYTFQIKFTKRYLMY